VPTASGERYADSGVSVWNKGQEATLDLNDRTYVCVENRQRSVIEDARFRGVEFRASGLEPASTFKILADCSAFVGSVVGTGGRRTRVPVPDPHATWVSAGDHLGEVSGTMAESRFKMR
jgi:membrane-bound lysozyme inhibitor of c-type lysozyme MliC